MKATNKNKKSIIRKYTRHKKTKGGNSSKKESSISKQSSTRKLLNSETKQSSNELIQACMHKNQTKALELINSNSIDVGYVDSNGNTALIQACANKMKKVALELIKKGADSIPFGQVNKYGYTALLWACYHNMSFVILALIKTNKSNPGHANKHGHTALMWLCENKNETVALALLKKHINEVNLEQVDSSNDTALLLAIKNKMYFAANAMTLTKKANPGIVDKNGNTALTIMCKITERENIIKNLLKNYTSEELNLKHVDEYGNTALIYSSLTYNSTLIQQIIEKGNANYEHVNNDGNTALLSLCNNKMDFNALSLIATGKSNPMQINNDGNTALILACKNKMTEVALKILETPGNGNPTHINKNEDTALLWACSGKMTEVALKILETPGNGNPEQVDKNGNTALILACQNEMIEMALKILETPGYGNPEQVNKNGNTALILASSNEIEEEIALKILQTPGHGKPEQVNNEEYTALLYACEYGNGNAALHIIKTGKSNPGHVAHNTTALIDAVYWSSIFDVFKEVVLELLATGESKPEFFNSDGDTALIDACKRNLPEIALAIIATGKSNPEQKNKDGYTALTYACKNKMKDVIYQISLTNEYYINDFNDNCNSITYKQLKLLINLTPKKLKLSKINYNNIEEKSVFDIIEGETTFDKLSKNSVVFVLSNSENNIGQITSIPKLTLFKIISDETIFYNCEEVNNPDSANEDKPYFGLNSIGLYGLCDLHYIKTILSTNGTVVVQLIPTTELKYTISDSSYSYYKSKYEYLTSSDHCQERTNKMVYDVLEIKN